MTVQNENCDPQKLVQLEKTEPIKRAWLMVRLADANNVNLIELACNFVDAINSTTVVHNEYEYKRFDNDIRNFAVRAEAVSWTGDEGETYHFVVPVSAKDEPTIYEMCGVIKSVAGAETIVHIAQVNLHFPINPYYAQGHIAKQEENAPAGPVHPDGHNPWG